MVLQNQLDGICLFPSTHSLRSVKLVPLSRRGGRSVSPPPSPQKDETTALPFTGLQRVDIVY